MTNIESDFAAYNTFGPVPTEFECHCFCKVFVIPSLNVTWHGGVKRCGKNEVLMKGVFKVLPFSLSLSLSHARSRGGGHPACNRFLRGCSCRNCLRSVPASRVAIRGALVRATVDGLAKAGRFQSWGGGKRVFDQASLTKAELELFIYIYIILYIYIYIHI